MSLSVRNRNCDQVTDVVLKIHLDESGVLVSTFN